MLDEPAQTIGVYATQSTIRLLRRLGNGNLSAGLRALTIICERIPDHTRAQILAQRQEPQTTSTEDDPW